MEHITQNLIVFCFHMSQTHALLPVHCEHCSHNICDGTSWRPESASIFSLIWFWLLHDVLNVLVKELRDFVVFLVVQTVMEFEEIGCFRLG